MFVLYLVKLIFYALWFIARLTWSLLKLAVRIVAAAFRKVRDFADAEERECRCRGQKRYA